MQRALIIGAIPTQMTNFKFRIMFTIRIFSETLNQALTVATFASKGDAIICVDALRKSNSTNQGWTYQIQ